VPDPKNKENGYVDTKAASDNMFYRLVHYAGWANVHFFKRLKGPLLIPRKWQQTSEKKLVDLFSAWNSTNRRRKLIQPEAERRYKKTKRLCPIDLCSTAQEMENIHFEFTGRARKEVFSKVFTMRTTIFCSKIKEYKGSIIDHRQNQFLPRGLV
jgi:hypothetical protein